jgi:PhzF family phenazine biosynthesis protein
MLKIAATVGFNETAFVCQSEIADFKFRYFTPGHEMNLCGHGTIGAVYSLYRQNRLEAKNFTIETKAGVLPIQSAFENERLVVTMQQTTPKFRKFNGSTARLAQGLGLTETAIDSRYPIVYGNTGIWTLVVPIKELVIFQQMVPNNQQFPEILTEIPTTSIHPFCFETVHADNDLHARHFSSPYSGTVEDPVTGTASGVLGAYYQTYVKKQTLPQTIFVEQGIEMNRDGQVAVHVTGENQLQIAISGTAVYVDTIVINL